MSKEMYISSSPHETKVAVLEDDQLVEVYFERDTDVGLVGGIYKGRVSRVLPGMQSAFVDIGLERDAFLYVSDFYEDQEEYDKVFEEAEARATKLTTQQADAAAEAPMSAPAAEAVVASVAAVAPTVPAPSATKEASPPAAPVAGPVASQPSAGRESRARRPFDARRGRRRRHRDGRPDFREGRPEERRFSPAPRAEEVPSESHAFEVLPGESLAKYKNATSSSAQTVVSPEPTSTDTWAAEGDRYVEIIKHDRPGVEAVDLSSAREGKEEPVAESDGIDPLLVADASAQAPAAPVTTVLTDSMPEISAGATQATIASSTAESTGPAEASTPAAPVAASAHVAAPEPESKPEPAEEIAADYEDASSEEDEEEFAEEVVARESAETLSDTLSGPDEVGVAEEEIESEEESLEEDEEEFEDSAEVETEEEAGLAAEIAASEAPAGAVGEVQPVAEVPPGCPQAPSDDDSASRVQAAGGDRTYTLREPNQRGRFAPRRRRGRRGTGGRRFDNKPREAARSGANHHPVQISEVLKEGQEILVQIAKEPLGTKGARITSHVALPGRYLVFMPTIDHIGVSRKIPSEEERLRLRNIILEHKGSMTGGYIVRTAGQGRSEDEFKADLKFLSTLWNDIKSKSERLKAPSLIHRDLDLVQRLLRDLLTPDFKCVRVDSEVDYERVLDFVNRCQPALVGKVKLYSRDTPLYEEFGIQAELDKALKPKVWLKSGGYIVINQTEALVAVDVNTGKYVGKTNRLEDTIVKTNVDAVKEIVRQVRLRDLGGIIVIDFIDMDERKNRARVVQALEEALRSDRAPTKVISFHDFGLVAVTRKRVKQSLERTLCEPCNYCTGAGWIKSVNTVCNEILMEARKMAKGIEGNVITLRVNPEVAKALKSREGSLIAELESMVKKDIIIKSDPVVHQERFEIF